MNEATRKKKKKLTRFGGKKARATATLALLPQSAPPAPVAAADPWVWSKSKRRAVELLCKGVSKTQIAEVLGKGRRTIIRWSQDPVFRAACEEWASEEMRKRRGKRIHSIGVISDTVTRILNKHLKHMDEKIGGGQSLSKEGIQQLSMLFRENREMFNQQRQDFGDNVDRKDHRVSFQIFPGPGQVPGVTETERQQALKAAEVGGQSFESYLKSHGDPALLKLPANNPTQALVTVGRALAADSVLLDALFEEDQPADGEEA